jgi:hypothetical protein
LLECGCTISKCNSGNTVIFFGPVGSVFWGSDLLLLRQPGHPRYDEFKASVPIPDLPKLVLQVYLIFKFAIVILFSFVDRFFLKIN